MRVRRLSCILGSSLALVAGACDSTVLNDRKLEETQVLASTADLRMTYRDRANYNYDTNQVVPTRILCTEPSPDVAKVMQTAFGTSVGASVFGSGSGSASVSAATAEALAQLGERLATIQLLRDGLYRACEAYANGAISDTEYVVLLSRYDDTMVTMLLGELAAGAFGRSLAGLGGSAESTAQAQAEGLREASEKLDASLDASREESIRKEAAANEARNEAVEAEKKAASTGDPNDQAAAQEAREAATRKETEAREAKEAEKAITSATTSAKAAATVVAAGGISHQPDKDVAMQIAEMQRKFLENINSDALVMACIHALSNPSAAKSRMADLCDGRDGILSKVVDSQKDLLESVKSRNVAMRDTKAFRESIEQVLAIIQNAEQLRKAAAKAAE